MTFHRPHEKILTIWRLVLTAAVIPPAFLCSFLLDAGSLPWLLLSVLWIAVYLFLYLYYLPRRYDALRFYIQERCICLQGGVFSRKLSALPLANIQFTTILATPLDRLFGLCMLRIVSPGAQLVLPGLRRKDAEDLILILTAGREGEL